MMTAEEARPDDDGAFEDIEEPIAGSRGEPITARELLQTALVDDEDPRFPLWLPVPGIAGAVGWATYVAVAQGGDFLITLLWPGVAILALTTVVTWFGWQLEID